MYDLSWSNDASHIAVGCIDHSVRIWHVEESMFIIHTHTYTHPIFTVYSYPFFETDRCVHVISDHSYFVQGVAFDPMGQYLATQGGDRAMHVYMYVAGGTLQKPALSAELVVKHVRRRRGGVAGNTGASGRDGGGGSTGGTNGNANHDTDDSNIDVEKKATDALQTTDVTAYSHNAMSCPVTPSATLQIVSQSPVFTPNSQSSHSIGFPPPPPHHDNAANDVESNKTLPPSPKQPQHQQQQSQHPPVTPALTTKTHHRAKPTVQPTSGTGTIRMFFDETFPSFFRRLSFSPDGSLLAVPAGIYQNAVAAAKAKDLGIKVESMENGDECIVDGVDGDKKVMVGTSGCADGEWKNTAYIFARGNITG